LSKTQAIFGELKMQTVLVIDDTQANLSVLLSVLNQHNLKVLSAKNGSMGIKRAEIMQPDLILLDIMMPDMDGFEVCNILKSQDSTKDIPVIFMSSLTETMDKVRGFKVGGADYITKPIQHEEVLLRINTQLKLQYQKHALEQQNQTLTATMQELEQAKKLAEKTSIEKSRFMANLSHELKMPLTSIKQGF